MLRRLLSGNIKLIPETVKPLRPSAGDQDGFRFLVKVTGGKVGLR